MVVLLPYSKNCLNGRLAAANHPDTAAPSLESEADAWGWYTSAYKTTAVGQWSRAIIMDVAPQTFDVLVIAP